MPKPQTPNPTLRKPPTFPTKPSISAVTSFVEGSEAPAVSTEQRPEPPQETKRKRLTVDIPIDHWWALKTKSMHEGRSLQQILATAVAELVVT